MQSYSLPAAPACSLMVMVIVDERTGRASLESLRIPQCVCTHVVKAMHSTDGMKLYMHMS